MSVGGVSVYQRSAVRGHDDARCSHGDDDHGVDVQTLHDHDPVLGERCDRDAEQV
jgi:hypothetical protein